jgi:hypothetical protein
MRRPQANNVYGQIVSPDGLAPLRVAIENAFGPGCVSLFHARPGAPEMLRIRTDAADFESLPLPGGMDYLLNGAVAGGIDDVKSFAQRLSDAFVKAKIEHTFDVHDGTRVILSLP